MLVRTGEVLCWVAGIALIVFYAGARTDAAVARHSDVAAFEDARIQLASAADPGHTESNTLATRETPSSFEKIPEPDMSLWNQDRIDDYQASLQVPVGLPQAVLAIPKLGLTVPVYEGTNALVLNRGVGHIVGTPEAGDAGNFGIAGHRDGYFRGLKDIKVGDSIEVQTLTDILTYTITDVFIVDKDDNSPLAPTETPTITLVTCYPFYFVGHAPERYIVWGELVEKSADRSSS
ncbi:MAG: class D sortase [Gammaproteobacteria bacterium]